MSAILAPSLTQRFRRPATAAWPALAVTAAWGATAAISLSTVTTGDYLTGGPVAGDNPGPAIAELVHGNLGGVASHQPWMGLTSIIVRAPFAALASPFGGGNLLTYRLGAFACLIPIGLLAIWLVARGVPAAAGRLAGVLAALVLLVSPIVIDAVRAGHAEEILAAVLATGAVLAATRGRAGWAGVMLGLAVGTKAWTLVAAGPVLLATDRPGRTAAIAGALALLLAAGAPLADPAAYSRARHWVNGNLVNPVSLWWPLSMPVHLRSGALAPARALPGGLTRASAFLFELGAVVAGSLVIRATARRRGGPCDALALLALLGLVRCACDPTTLEYYYLALLVPLAVWEAVGLGRAPVVTGVATVAVALLFGGAPRMSETAVSGAALACTLLLGAYLARGAFATSGKRRLAPAWRPTTTVSEV